ncbi:hypothetical protein MKEN_00285500 [Mycena kentingensis (nom. inval.)]|nr:hypothetical protein MKEN_00285500 [Mycena kentingensis (nom. inval.)]
MPPSPPSAEDEAFIHALPFSTVQKFCAETFHPQFIQDSPGHFKDLDWINVPQLRAYVERRRIEPAVATRDAFATPDGLPTLPHGIIWDYRNAIYHPNHIAAFSHRFLDTKWIDPAHLLTFLENTQRLEERMSLQPPPIQFKDIRNIVGMPESPPYDTPGSYGPLPANYKLMQSFTLKNLNTDGHYKPLPTQVDQIPSPMMEQYRAQVPASLLAIRAANAAAPPRSFELDQQQALYESYAVGQESGGGSGGDRSHVVPPVKRGHDFDKQSQLLSLDEDDLLPPSSPPLPSSDGPFQDCAGMPIRAPAGYRSLELFNAYDDWRESGTEWGKDGVQSYVRDEAFDITSRRSVTRVEYVFGLPPHFPIPETETASICDLDHPRFDLRDNQGKLYTIDALIKNHDNDSWRGPTGASDSRAWVTFGPGQEPILCRRSRLKCTGGFSCSFIDPQHVNKVRRDLDAPCACTGFAIVRENKVANSATRTWFADCSQRSAAFPNGHRTYGIPVNQDLFLRAFHDRPIAEGRSKDTKPCAGIYHPNSGGKITKPNHTHIIDGVVRKAEIVHHDCSAERCIYVPDDPAIRMALVLHTPEKPHTHILAAFTKKTIELTTAYEDCIVASGTVGATVGKVDKAPSTSLILDGKTPAQFAPALQSKVLKAKILREVKTKSFPAGLGIEGVFHFEVGTMIVTAVPDLLKLLDDAGVNSFEGDVTYKRVSGDLNEWEGVIYYKPLERAITVTRVNYGASADFFEGMFDQIREVKVAVTGKPIAFERLVPGGNLIAFNSDMDSAQVLGFSRSLIKTNVPEHSGIPANITPQEFAPYIIKLCITHAKRAILDFRSLVNDQDYHRLLNFATEITSEETLAGFRDFVYSLGIPKITQWFDHKDLNAWTLQCLCKGRSQLTAEQWDSTPSTTNTGEAQHHWTNMQTGIKLPLVEAIETARKVDLAVLSEVQLAFESGVLTNPHNELAKRTARKLTRHAATARKYRETRAAAQAADVLDADLAEAARQQKEAAERLKDLRAQKSAGKSKGKGKGTAHSVVVAAIAAAPAQAILSAPHPASGATHLQNNDSPAPVALDTPMPSLNNLMEYVDTDVAFTAAELALFEQQGLDLGGDGIASDTFSLETFSGNFSDEAFSDDVFSGDALNAFFGDAYAFSSDATLVDIASPHVLDDRAYAALLGASTKAGNGGALSEDASTLPRLPPPPRRSPSPPPVEITPTYERSLRSSARKRSADAPPSAGTAPPATKVSAMCRKVLYLMKCVLSRLLTLACQTGLAWLAPARSPDILAWALMGLGIGLGRLGVSLGDI